MSLRHLRALAVAPLLVLPACLSMQAVQQYAAYTQGTVQEVRPVAKDFYASCLRTNSYKPLALHSECKTEQDASKAILKVAGVLDDYAAALGSLAADAVVSYDTDIDALTGEIKRLGVAGDKADAVGGLAKLIAKAATSRYQQKQVGRFVTESNASVVKVADTLADLVDTHYGQAIRLEMSGWRDSYRRVERVARTNQPLEWESYSQTQWQRHAELEAKLAAATALARSIKKIGATHARLEHDAKDLTAEEVGAVVRRFVDEAKPVIRDIREAF